MSLVECAHTQGTQPRAGDTTGPPKCVPATAVDNWLPARVRPRSAKKRWVQTRPLRTTTYPLCVPERWVEGLGSARAGPQEAKRGRASDLRAGITQQVSPIAVSRGRRPPVGSLGLLTQGGVSPRTHAWEQRTPDARLRGERACGGTPGPARATRKGGACRTPRREAGGGPPLRCLAGLVASVYARPTPQCLFTCRPTMHGMTTGPWIPSSVSAHATQAVDIRVCEAEIAITRRANAATHCSAALSDLPCSATTGRHIFRLRLAASNHTH